jgi:DNA end-binding protein Ku
VVLSRREHLLVLEPRGKGILATTLRSAREVRDDEAYFADIGEVEIADDMLDLATHIIGRKKGHFEKLNFEDRYEEALLEMLRAKGEGREVETPKAPKSTNVVNLMDALRKSIESERGDGAKSASPAKAKAAPRRASSTAKKPAARKPARKAG